MKIYTAVFENKKRTFHEYDTKNLIQHESLKKYVRVLHPATQKTIQLISNEFFVSIEDVMKYWAKENVKIYKLNEIKGV